MSHKQQKRLYTRGMGAFASAVVVLKTWNMIIFLHILVEVRVMFQIFSCFVKSAIEVNQIVAIVKHIIKKLELIAVQEKQLGQPLQLLLQPNRIQPRPDSAQVQQKKGLDVRIGQLIQVDAVITMIKKRNN